MSILLSQCALALDIHCKCGKQRAGTCSELSPWVGGWWMLHDSTVIEITADWLSNSDNELRPSHCPRHVTYSLLSHTHIYVVHFRYAWWDNIVNGMTIPLMSRQGVKGVGEIERKWAFLPRMCYAQLAFFSFPLPLVSAGSFPFGSTLCLSQGCL